MTFWNILKLIKIMSGHRTLNPKASFRFNDINVCFPDASTETFLILLQSITFFDTENVLSLQNNIWWSVFLYFPLNKTIWKCISPGWQQVEYETEQSKESTSF